MSGIEILIYTLVFVAVSLLVSIPAIKWYKMNTGVETRKKLSVLLMILVAIVIITALMIELY